MAVIGDTFNGIAFFLPINAKDKMYRNSMAPSNHHAVNDSLSVRKCK